MPGLLRREDDADAPGAGKVARALALQLAKQTGKFETIN
jgi:hypothetical protein